MMETRLSSKRASSRSGQGVCRKADERRRDAMRFHAGESNGSLEDNLVSMQLEIYFKSKQEVELKLIDEGKVLDVCIIPLDTTFDNMLVTSIDKILKENRMDLVSLKIVQVTGLTDEHSTSVKIAQTVAKAINTMINGQN